MSSPISFPEKESVVPTEVSHRKTHRGKKKHPKQDQVHKTAKEAIPKPDPLSTTPAIRSSFDPVTQIPAQAKLFEISRNLQAKSKEAPLKSAHTERDIYMTSDTVFKPGEEAAVKASICYGLLAMNGLEKSIPPAKSVKLGEVIAAQDDGVAYKRMKTPKGQELIVNKEELYAVKKDKIGYYFKDGKAIYRFTPKGKDSPGIYSVENVGKGETDFEEHLDDDFIRVVDPKDPSKTYFVPTESRSYVQHDDEGNYDYVMRGDQEYRLLKQKDGIHVVGKDIQGMVQQKVSDIYVGSGRGGLDLRSDSSKVEEFFGRIDFQSFTDAFIATIMLRPHDGKVAVLDESNFLFQALPNAQGKVDPLDPTCKLRCVLIDLDEAMPEGVDDLLKGKEAGIHPVRNGLMGFPQAREKLKGGDKEYALKAIRTITENQYASEKFLKGHETDSEHFSSAHTKAYKEVVARLDEFVKEKGTGSFSLEELFFHVFPNYKKQWDSIGDERPPVTKAEWIGFQSARQIKEVVKKRE